MGWQQQALLSSQAALAEVGEQRGVAQTQAQGMLRERDQAYETQAQLHRDLQALQPQLQAARGELASMREQAAAQARADTLSQQLADASRGNAEVTSGQRPRKTTPRSS